MSNERPPSPFPPDQFGPRTTQYVRLALLAVLGAVFAGAVTAFAYFESPYWNRIGLAPAQPILFSHRHHAGELHLDCRLCHATVETAPAAGMPTTTTCLTCHSQLFAREAMFAPLREHAASRSPLAWGRVNTLPDHVIFDHSIHVARGLACAQCHGDVASMALTAKARALTMRECLDCHRANSPSGSDAAGRNLLTNCSTCHH
ncbi:MAG TPA: cytochrome c3 family protein [Candidatus Didemnitutus sp.]|nr:cytochrome c3 family protein [Candidatus Didemnitutus sp.]